MDYRREIDGLRALAVLPVILFHAGFEAFSGGFVGVDVFFVISGYLITSIILAEKRAGSFSLIRFYERRARRILPALFLVMLACLPFAWWWLLPQDMQRFSQSVMAVTAFASNLFFWQSSGYFETASEMSPLLHTWSLAVEEQYYLLFPLFLIVTWRLGERWILALLTLVAGVSLAAAQWGSVANPSASFYLLPTRGWELLIGAFSAFTLADKQYKMPDSRVCEIGGALGLALITYAVFAFDRTTPFPGLYALIPTMGTALVILYTSQQTMTGRWLGKPWLVGIGLISYSAYLWHQPLFAFARHRSLNDPETTLLLALSVISLLLAYFSWRFVEVPFRNKRAFNRKQIFSFGVVGSVFFLLFGLSGHLSGGFSFPYRFNETDLPLLEAKLPRNTDYVRRRFIAREQKDFEIEDGRPKVLLIGDSYAQDLVNALYESDIASRIQLSTRLIHKVCGNLFLPRQAFEKNILFDKIKACENMGLHEDRTLRERMRQADEVWFASSWQDWQVPLIADSVAETRTLTGKPVRVFGRKNLGRLPVHDMLAKSETARHQIRNTMPKWQIEINEQMRQSLPEDVFVDVQRLLCGNDNRTCPLFTRDAQLITFDGTHLTPEGARFYGNSLKDQDWIKHLIARP